MPVAKQDEPGADRRREMDPAGVRAEEAGDVIEALPAALGDELAVDARPVELRPAPDLAAMPGDRRGDARVDRLHVAPGNAADGELQRLVLVAAATRPARCRQEQRDRNEGEDDAHPPF